MDETAKQKEFFTPSTTISLRSTMIERGETQKDVNYSVLNYIINKFQHNSSFTALDLPCGRMLFLGYMRKFFPNATLWGADIKAPMEKSETRFIAMDLTTDFPSELENNFDLITSISGVMMFGNTQNFIANCSARLKKGGTFIVTNDNASTIKDKLSFLLFGKARIFDLFYDSKEELTQNIPIQELCRLLMVNGLQIEDIIYTSFYKKDLIYLPFAALLYPIQWLYMRKRKNKLPENLRTKMFPFKYCFCKHYIIVANRT